MKIGEIPAHLDFDRISNGLEKRLDTVKKQEIETIFGNFRRLAKVYKISGPIDVEPKPNPQLIEPEATRYIRVFPESEKLRLIKHVHGELNNNDLVRYPEDKQYEVDLGSVDNNELIEDGCRLAKEIIAAMKKVAKPLDPSILAPEQEVGQPQPSNTRDYI